MAVIIDENIAFMFKLDRGAKLISSVSDVTGTEDDM
jgi:hypothetical protein